MMDRCGDSVNCTDLYTPRTIQVLPDIVGIGVGVHALAVRRKAHVTADPDIFSDNCGYGLYHPHIGLFHGFSALRLPLLG